MSPEELSSLVQRLGRDPRDKEALAAAHLVGLSDRGEYADLLEAVAEHSADPRDASHWLTEAAAVHASGLRDPARAAELLRIAVDRDPTNERAVRELAKHYRKSKDVEALADVFERRADALAAACPDEQAERTRVAGLYTELARLVARGRAPDPARALRAYERALSLDPRSTHAAREARALYTSLGRWADAVSLFELERQHTLAPEQLLRLFREEAEVRRFAGDLRGVTDALRYAHRYDEGDLELAEDLATSILQRIAAGEAVSDEERREAASLFLSLAETYEDDNVLSIAEQALAVDPGNDAAMQLATRSAEAMGRGAELGPRRVAYLAASPNGAHAELVRWELAGAYEATGRLDEAIEVLEPLAAAPSPELLERLCTLYRRAGRIAALVETMDRQARSLPPPERLKMLVQIARMAKEHGLAAEAVARYRLVLDASPGHPEAVKHVAEALREQGQLATLRDVLSRAAGAQGVQRDRARKLLVEVAELSESPLGDLDSAVRAWSQVCDLDRADAPARESLKRVLERAGRWDDLVAVLDYELSEAREAASSVGLLKRLATVHELKRSDFVAAARAWERVAALAVEDGAPIIAAARLLEKAERLDLAAHSLSKGIALVEDPALKGRLYQRLGALRERLGSPVLAGDAYAAEASVSASVQAWKTAVRCYVAAQCWPKAADAVARQAASELDPIARAALLAREAELLFLSDDPEGALARLESACDLDRSNDAYAAEIERRLLAAGANEPLAAFLLRRAATLPERERRLVLRKRAASIQDAVLHDAAASRRTLRLALEDGDDAEVVAALADAAERCEDFQEAAELLRRLASLRRSPAEQAEVLLREAALLASRLRDPAGALERYERVLREVDPYRRDVLDRIAEVERERANPAGVAGALERALKLAETAAQRLAVLGPLAALYEGSLADPGRAIHLLRAIVELDPDDLAAKRRLAAQLEAVADADALQLVLRDIARATDRAEEASELARRRARLLEGLGRADEALEALGGPADAGDPACRRAYLELGDRLNRDARTAAKLVEWHAAAPSGPGRSEALRGAFERYLRLGMLEQAAHVALKLSSEAPIARPLARRLEEAALAARALAPLATAHALQADGLAGLERATEMVRQAEAIAVVSDDRDRAVRHGESSLSGLALADAEPLLLRLAAIAADDEQVVGLYERQVARCAAPSERRDALASAAVVAARAGSLARCKRFLALGIAASADDEDISRIESAAAVVDAELGGTTVRRLFAEALGAAVSMMRDGGRRQSALLRRAALVAHRDLGDIDRAVEWFGEALFARVDASLVATISQLSAQVAQLRLAVAALARSAAAPPPGRPEVSFPRYGGAAATPQPDAGGRRRVSERDDDSRLTPLAYPPQLESLARAEPPVVPAFLPPGVTADAPSRAEEVEDEQPTEAPPAFASPGELIIQLFEAVHDLHFEKSVEAGADFVLGLALRRLGGTAAYCHLFDETQGELVVLAGSGPGANGGLGLRTRADDEVLDEVLRKKAAVVMLGAGGQPPLAGERWRRLERPVRCVVAAAAEHEGRLLGMLELADPPSGTGRAEATKLALAYIGERFGEFLAARRNAPEIETSIAE
jgi:hypothetical protein